MSKEKAVKEALEKVLKQLHDDRKNIDEQIKQVYQLYQNYKDETNLEIKEIKKRLENLEQI